MESGFNRIFIYGVPGSGKTYYTRKLSKDLGIPVIELDRKIKKKYGTCEAYKMFGAFNKENVIKGLLSVRNETRKKVRELIIDNDFIMEGAFLDPNDLIKYGKLILLNVPDEKEHKKKYFTHHEKLLDLSGEPFKAARIIQDYLIEEAKKLGIEAT